jgi:hypothetical protein
MTKAVGFVAVVFTMVMVCVYFFNSSEKSANIQREPYPWEESQCTEELAV